MAGMGVRRATWTALSVWPEMKEENHRDGNTGPWAGVAGAGV